MTIQFLNAGWLWLFVLGGIPLLLHLFARSRPPVYHFSSVEFLHRIVRTTLRLRKPQDYLLLALRTLAFLALIAMVLRPLLFTRHRLANAFEQKNVVLVIDASASMGCVEGAQTRFAWACGEAGKVLGGLTGMDRANIIWIDANPTAVFPELSPNLAYLKDALRRARSTSQTGASARAFALALEQVERIEGKREICIVSDFQRSSWEGVDLAVPENVDLLLLKAGRGQIANLSLVRAAWEPAHPVAGEEVRISAELANFGPAPQSTTVFCSAGENRQSQNVTVPAQGRANAAFRYRVTAASPLPIQLALTEDAFTGDDFRYGVVPVRDVLRIGVAAVQDPQTAAIWRQAVESLPWAQAVPVSESMLREHLPDLDVLLLSGWPGSPAVSHPHLICLPAAPVNPDQLGPLLGLPPQKRQTLQKLTADEPWALQITQEDDPLFRTFARGEYGDFSQVRMRQRLDLLPETWPGSQCLLRYSDGVPALLRFPAGHFLWNLPLEPVPSNLAGQIVFLPLFAELLQSAREAGSPVMSEFRPGENLSWEPAEPVDRAKLAVLHGSDKALGLTQTNSRGQYLTEAALDPGLYRWIVDSKPVHYSPVNFPVEESNLDCLELEEIRKRGAVAVRDGGDLRFLRDGLTLWPMLLGAAVGLICLELAVMGWATKTARA